MPKPINDTTSLTIKVASEVFFQVCFQTDIYPTGNNSKTVNEVAKWISAINIDNWNSGLETWLCSKHVVSGMLDF